MRFIAEDAYDRRPLSSVDCCRYLDGMGCGEEESNVMEDGSQWLTMRLL
jgi:hypothetical protein